MEGLLVVKFALRSGKRLTTGASVFLLPGLFQGGQFTRVSVRVRAIGLRLAIWFIHLDTLGWRALNQEEVTFPAVRPGRY